VQLKDEENSPDLKNTAGTMDKDQTNTVGTKQNVGWKEGFVWTLRKDES